MAAATLKNQLTIIANQKKMLLNQSGLKAVLGNQSRILRNQEAIIKNHVLIEKKRSSGLVDMGNTVRFREDGEAEESYRIVGPAEADPKAGRVSYESALGKALMGHRVGDEVEVSTPNGSYRVRIVGLD